MARRKKAAQASHPWPADKVERRPLSALYPYAKNARTHTRRPCDGDAGALENNQEEINMAHGGKRAGAGRKTGAVTKKTREIAERAAAEGVTPLEIMLDNARFFYDLALTTKPDKKLTAAEALTIVTSGRRAAQDAARDCAPYMHPRLAAVEHTGKGGGPIDSKIIIEFVKPPTRDGGKG